MISNHRKKQLAGKARAARRYPWRQGYRKLIVWALLLPVLLVLPLLMMKGYYHLRLKQRLAHFQEQGYPLDQETYMARHPIPNPAENLAPLFIESHTLLRNESPAAAKWDEIEELYPTESFPEDWLADYHFLDSKPPVWRKPLQRALAQPEGYFFSEKALDFHEHWPISALSNYLLVDALFAVEIGDRELAVKRIEESINVASPMYRSALPERYHAVFYMRNLMDTLMRLIAKFPLEKEALHQLDRAMESLRYWAVLERYLDMALLRSIQALPSRSFGEELRLGRREYQDYKKRHQDHEERQRQRGLVGYLHLIGSRIGSSYSPPEPTSRALLRSCGLADCDLLNALYYYEAARGLVALGQHQAVQEAKKLERKQRAASKNASWYSRRKMDVEEIIKYCAEVEAFVSCCQLAFAVERYRRDHNEALPESLSALAPAYIAAVPNDPFTGEAMQYRLESPTGYVVYSVGSYQGKHEGCFFYPSSSGKRYRQHDPLFLVQR